MALTAPEAASSPSQLQQLQARVVDALPPALVAAACWLVATTTRMIQRLRDMATALVPKMDTHTAQVSKGRDL
jgi:hypothetical protein